MAEATRGSDCTQASLGHSPLGPSLTPVTCQGPVMLVCTSSLSPLCRLLVSPHPQSFLSSKCSRSFGASEVGCPITAWLFSAVQWLSLARGCLECCGEGACSAKGMSGTWGNVCAATTPHVILHPRTSQFLRASISPSAGWADKPMLRGEELGRWGAGPESNPAPSSAYLNKEKAELGGRGQLRGVRGL